MAGPVKDSFVANGIGVTESMKHRKFEMGTTLKWYKDHVKFSKRSENKDGQELVGAVQSNQQSNKRGMEDDANT